MAFSEGEPPAYVKRIQKKFAQVNQELDEVQLDCNLGAWDKNNGEVLQARYARADSLLRATKLLLSVDPDDPTVQSQAQLKALLTQAVSAFGLAVVAQTQALSDTTLPSATPHKP